MIISVSNSIDPRANGVVFVYEEHSVTVSAIAALARGQPGCLTASLTKLSHQPQSLFVLTKSGPKGLLGF